MISTVRIYVDGPGPALIVQRLPSGETAHRVEAGQEKTFNLPHDGVLQVREAPPVE